uniref:Zinc finger domain containing protein n=1 Tax=Haemonchus contortus TaxID=6289 RepID=A0A7I4YG41_HAECO
MDNGQEYCEPSQRMENASSRAFTNRDRTTNAPDVRISVEDWGGFPSSSNSVPQENGGYYSSDAGGRRSSTGRPASSVIEAADRLRGEYARLQQTIHENQEAQSLCTMVTATIPFVFVFVLKMVFDNFFSILRIVIALGGFLAVDSRVQELFTAGHSASSIRITAVIIFLVLFYFTSGICSHDDEFNMRNVLLLKYAGVVYHGFFFTVYVLTLSDTFIKMVVSGAKLIVSLSGISMSMKRKINQLIEYLSQTYRCVVPVPQWLNYFIGKELSNFALYANGLLFTLYGIIKARELWGLFLTTFECASRIVRPTRHGNFPTADEVDQQGMCSVCHGEFSSPIKLVCSHIFCSACIERWLECENTCPNCRAVVEKKDNSWKDGATSKGIRFC